MATPTEKVIDLIRLACDAGAPEPEQRSAALIACRLIVRHSLYVGERLTPAPAPPVPPPPAAAPARPAPNWPAPRAATRTRPSPRVIRTRYRSRCVHCWGMVDTDDLCIWVSGLGLSHPACYQE